MIKGIEVVDLPGIGHIGIKKERGKFTLDQIVDTLREYWPDVYLLKIDARDADGSDGIFDGRETKGDYVEVFSIDRIEEMYGGKQQ